MALNKITVSTSLKAKLKRKWSAFSDMYVQRWFHIGKAVHWLQTMKYGKKALQITVQAIMSCLSNKLL